MRATPDFDFALGDNADMIREVAEGHGDLAFAFVMAKRPQVDALLDDSARANYFARLAATAKDPATILALETYAAGLRADQRKPVDRTLGQVRQRLADEAAQVAGIKAWLAGRK